jgi:hypothetical protein
MFKEGRKPMSDFLLEPDQIEPDRPERRSPVRMVSTGLAPTAALPTTRGKAKEPAPAYAPCVTCHAPVLRGLTASGEQLMLDTGLRTYAVDWSHGETTPVLRESRGYPEHRCGVLGRPR